MRNLILALIVAFPSVSFTQYCMTGGPSSNIDSNLEWLTFTGDGGSSINFTGCNGSPQGVLGVEEYTTQTALISAGVSYTLNLQFGTCGGNYSGVGEVWIDYNANQVFEASESIGTWQGTPPTTASSFNFTVPVSAMTGNIKMRVMQREGGSFPLDPCASFTWGSVTDFQLYVANGIDCSTYVGDNSADPRIVNALPFAENFNNSICYTNYNPIYSSPDVYYLVKNLSSSPVISISTCGSSFDTFLSIADGQGNILTNNDDANCGTAAQIEFSTAGHDSIYVIVEGWGNAAGNYQLTINEGPLGLESNNKEQLKIIPNPATDIISFEKAVESVYLTDINGKFIAVQLNNNTVDIKNLEPGYYMVYITTTVGQSVQKLLKL